MGHVSALNLSLAFWNDPTSAYGTDSWELRNHSTEAVSQQEERDRKKYRTSPNYAANPFWTLRPDATPQ